ncbi:aromatic-ring hydroxylase C-terminal domain-containing protein [Phytohabitans suffuscus]|uniref:aromatic-ring hydroxylase C-terminal domain-containing protein n=1 Tax=Phytohabitans suffuscus TaxID=624315 RepID=UPI0038CD3C5A
MLFDERYDASGVLWYEDGQLATEAPWAADRYQDDPRPGHRAPDGYVDPWGDTLYDRIGNDLALLVSTPDRAVERAFTAAASARALPFTVVHLTDGAARQAYAADNVLVRPDQHVAWRGAELPAGGAGAVLDRVLGHQPGAGAPTSPDLSKGATHDLALR